MMCVFHDTRKSVVVRYVREKNSLGESVKRLQKEPHGNSFGHWCRLSEMVLGRALSFVSCTLDYFLRRDAGVVHVYAHVYKLIRK